MALMPSIPFDDFLFRANISRGSDFSSRWADIEAVVSLRALKRIDAIEIMPREYCRRLLEHTTLVGDKTVFPYRDCRITMIRVDVHDVAVGQTFVQRDKYAAILENFHGIFDGFSVSRGISKLTALRILGKDSAGRVALAHYLPPILEVHNGRRVLMDGIHRSFLIMNSGTTIESIVINDVRIPFPCSFNDWSEVHCVDTKPPEMKDRYFNLKPELFRDVKFVGVDG